MYKYCKGIERGLKKVSHTHWSTTVHNVKTCRRYTSLHIINHWQIAAVMTVRDRFP
jgi:hypothetical protein